MNDVQEWRPSSIEIINLVALLEGANNGVAVAVDGPMMRWMLESRLHRIEVGERVLWIYDQAYMPR